MVEISLFQDDEPQHFTQILLFPYPDLTRIWVRMWLTPALDERPNVELRVMNPNGSENNSIFLIAHAETKVDSTLHLRSPQPGATYHCVAEMSVGSGADLRTLDRQEFDLLLEFRDPEQGQPGFGYQISPPAAES